MELLSTEMEAQHTTRSKLWALGRREPLTEQLHTPDLALGILCTQSFLTLMLEMDYCGFLTEALQRSRQVGTLA